MQVRHTGENITAEVIEILSSYRIEDKVGYFTLNNASNSNTAGRLLPITLALKASVRDKSIALVTTSISL